MSILSWCFHFPRSTKREECINWIESTKFLGIDYLLFLFSNILGQVKQLSGNSDNPDGANTGQDIYWLDNHTHQTGDGDDVKRTLTMIHIRWEEVSTDQEAWMAELLQFFLVNYYNHGLSRRCIWVGQNQWNIRTCMDYIGLLMASDSEARIKRKQSLGIQS